MSEKENKPNGMAWLNMALVIFSLEDIHIIWILLGEPPCSLLDLITDDGMWAFFLAGGHSLLQFWFMLYFETM